MEERAAITAFAALAHETRLRVFRVLIQAGPSGLPAGSIAERLDVPPSTLSFHLAHLERAGLLRATRRHRLVIYAADIEGMRRLLTYLTADCCQGHPEICGGLLEAIERCGC
jgi:ArsR family transcriptional regulator